jgi:hypothetical protein
MPELRVEKRPELKRHQIAHILEIAINKNNQQINPKPILPKKAPKNQPQHPKPHKNGHNNNKV